MAPDNHEQLRDLVRGQVWLPGDTDFDAVHRPWNLAIDQPVAAVVAAADTEDVVALVRYASRTGTGISAQPRGHGASGRAAGTILLRTGRLDQVEISPATMRATIGAGVLAGELQRAAAAHGLTGLPGSSPVVSVAGVALGGGLSWFGRAFGLVSDAVVSFDVVTADATRRTVTAETDPDLFWALRGGGGDLAVVTALELTLHEAPAVFGGRLLWPAEHAHAVARSFREITTTAPDRLSLWLELMQFPGAPAMVAIDVTFLGEEADARAAMAGIDQLPPPMSDSRRAMSAAELGSITAEPTDPVPSRTWAGLLTRLDDDVLATLLDEPITPLSLVQVRHLGGAFTRPSDSPHGPLDEPYAIYTLGVPGTPEVAAAIDAKQRALAAALPVGDRKPLTFLNARERLSDALPVASVERLRDLKAARDPGDVFRSNFGVRS